MDITLKQVERSVRNIFAAQPVPYSETNSHWYPYWPAVSHRDRRLWDRALKNAQNGPRVLVPSSIGAHAPSLIVESTLAVALTLRGANVKVLLCDGVLAGCQQMLSSQAQSIEAFVEHGPAQVCRWCFPAAYEMYASLKLPVLKYSDYLDPAANQRASEIASTLPIEEIPKFQLDGIAVGEHALAGALRYFARGDLAFEPAGEPVLRRYLQAALQTTFVTRQLVADQKIQIACFNHGIYVPQGLVGEVARHSNVRVINWMAGYRKRRFVFTHNETYHHALMTEPIANWDSVELTPELRTKTLDYLKSRWQGTRDWIWFHEKPQEQVDTIAAELGIDFSRPTIGLLTNVVWDAQLHYPANAFPNMLEWILQTVSYFARRPDLQLVIRIHPAEIRGTVPSRQPVLAEIQREFPELPPNVFVIPPTSQISTYAVMQQCDSVLIYGTKTGVELTSMGIPVIVAGEAWIRNKGITRDAGSVQDYIKILDELPLGERLDAATRERALKYAYHFYFRRMIPMEMFVPAQGWPFYKLEIESLTELLPGADPGLDLVCDGILNGTEFIYPAERLPDARE